MPDEQNVPVTPDQAGRGEVPDHRACGLLAGRSYEKDGGRAVVAGELHEGYLARFKLVTAALRLVWIPVAFGVLSGAVSVTAGLQDHRLAAFAIGLGVLADVPGAAVLI